MVVVEVRHRTMWIADRSWTRRTRRTRTRQESEAEGRSGRQERKAGRQEAGGRRQEATLIKSNNPHLAGGELKSIIDLQTSVGSRSVTVCLCLSFASQQMLGALCSYCQSPNPHERPTCYGRRPILPV